MNSTWLITSKLANQRARKVLFTCVVYTNTRYGVYHLLISRPRTSSIYHIRAVFHLNVKNIPRKSQRLRQKHSRIRFLAHAANHGRRLPTREKIPKRSSGIRAVSGGFEKHFPGPEKITRKGPRKAFGPEKFSGLLRNARLERDTAMAAGNQ